MRPYKVTRGLPCSRVRREGGTKRSCTSTFGTSVRLVRFRMIVAPNGVDVRVRDTEFLVTHFTCVQCVTFSSRMHY